jgi:hypothetical protein
MDEKITRTFKILKGSDNAKRLGLHKGGTVRVHAGLSYYASNADTTVSVTVDILNHNGTDIGGGADHETAVLVWPEIAPVVAFHLWGPRTGPMHYVANAVYWWELALGYSRWALGGGQDPAAIFASHCHWGSVPGDNADNPLEWTLEATGLDAPRAGDEDWARDGDRWVCGDKRWRSHAIGILRTRLQERLPQRLNVMREACRKALGDIGIDITWKPMAEKDTRLASL